MSGDTVIAAPSAIAMGFSFQCQLDERRILTCQTHVPADADPKKINEALDKIADALDRMEARYKLKQLEKHLHSRKILLEQAQNDMKRIDTKNARDWTESGRKGEYKPSQKEAAERGNFESTIGRIGIEIRDTEADMTECRHLLNGAGA